MKATHNGRVFVHRDFSSHSFTMTFVNQEFPIGLQANDLQLSEDYWLLGETIQNVIDFVNSNGGWTIIGWYSRGLINDRTLTGLVNGSNKNTRSNQNSAEVQVDGA